MNLMANTVFIAGATQGTGLAPALPVQETGSTVIIGAHMNTETETGEQPHAQHI